MARITDLQIADLQVALDALPESRKAALEPAMVRALIGEVLVYRAADIALLPDIQIRRPAVDPADFPMWNSQMSEMSAELRALGSKCHRSTVLDGYVYLDGWRERPTITAPFNILGEVG